MLCDTINPLLPFPEGPEVQNMDQFPRELSLVPTMEYPILQPLGNSQDLKNDYKYRVL